MELYKNPKQKGVSRVKPARPVSPGGVSNSKTNTNSGKGPQHQDGPDITGYKKLRSSIEMENSETPDLYGYDRDLNERYSEANDDS